MTLYELQANISIGINKAVQELSVLGEKATLVAEKIKNGIGGNNEANIDTNDANSSLKKLTSTISRQEQELDDLKTQYKEVYLAQGKGSQEAEELSKEIDKLSSELKENKAALSEAEQAANEFDNAMEQTGENVDGSSNKMMSTLKKLGAVIVATFAVDKIIEFGKATVNAAAEVAAEEAAFTQIMGEYATQASEKVNKIAETTGIVDSRLTPYMTSMTAKFKGLGYDVDEATDLASTGLNIAADAAAFWDKSMEDSMSALNSFVNGNYEGGEAIGLFANETTLASWAAKNLGYEWKDLTEKEKQFARLEFAKAMQEASGAAGQAAKESDAYANVQANLAEKWRQFKAQVGEPILQNIVLPAMQALGNFITNTLAPAVQGLIEKIKQMVSWFKENADTIKLVAAALGVAGAAIAAYQIVVRNMETWTKLATIAQKAWGTAVAIATGKINIATIATKAWNTVLKMNPIGLVVSAIVALVGILVIAYNKIEPFRNAVDSLWKVIKEGLLKALEALKPVFNSFMEVLKACWNLLKTIVIPIFKAAGAQFKLLWGIIKPIVTALKPLFEANFGAIGTIVKTVFNNMKVTITTIMNAIKNVIKAITSLIKGDWKGAWNSIKSVFSGILNGMKTIGTNTINAIKNVFKNGWNAVKKVFNGSGSFFSGVWTAIKKPFSSVASWFKNVFSKAWNGVKNVFSSGGKIFDGIKSGIANVFKTVVNGIIRGINKVISVPFKAINGLLNKIRNVKILGVSPFKGFWKQNPLSVPQIPTLYKGGVLEKGQVGLLEGNGAEAVVPLERNKKWINAVSQDMQETMPTQTNNLDTDKIVDRLDNLEKTISSLKIYLDSGVLVGELTPAFDTAFGNLAAGRERGR